MNILEPELVGAGACVGRHDDSLGGQCLRMPPLDVGTDVNDFFVKVFSFLYISFLCI